MKLFRWLFYLVILLGAAGSCVAYGARFADGPVAIFPGGPFQSGEIVEDPAADLSFAADHETIELQSGEERHSRTVWIVVVDGEAYVPCSLTFPPGKTWHKEALVHPNAEVRIDGKRYHRRLERVEDDFLISRLGEEVRDKYPSVPNSDTSQVWFFHLAPGS